MSILKKIQSDLATELKQLNESISESLHSSNPLLNSVIDSYLSSKGKQMRPILTILIAKMIGEPNKKTIDGGVAVELLHNASLIHDDVVDYSDTRRNKSTINTLWDNQIAVLVGDYFVTTALDRAINTKSLKIIGTISKRARELSLGELDQINNTKTNCLSWDAYKQVIERKTSSLFVACAEIACDSVKAKPADKKILIEFTNIFGICFQIKDDIFDYYPNDSEIIGKPAGNDLREGKVSLPLIHVLMEDINRGDYSMVRLCQKDNLNESEIDTLLQYAKDKGGIEYANKFIKELYDKGVRLLDRFPDCEAKENLILLFRYVIERNR